MAASVGLRVRFRFVDEEGGDPSSSFEEGRFVFRGEKGIRLRRASRGAKTVSPIDIALDVIDDVSVENHEGIGWRLILALIEEDAEAGSFSRYLEVEVAAKGSGQAEPLALKAALDALLATYTEVVEDD